MNEPALAIVFWILLSFASLFKSAPTAPPRPEPTAQAKARLESVLAKYENNRKEMKSFRITFTRTCDDTAFRTRTVYRGEARGAGTDLLRITEQRDNRDEKTTTLFNGKRITVYDYNEKTKRIFDPSAAQDDLTSGFLNWFDVMFDEQRLVFAGKPSNVLKQRFQFRFMKKDDAHYYYLQLEPRNKNESFIAYAALAKETYLPRTIIVVQPSGVRTMWDFVSFETDLKPPVTLEELSKGLPKDWTEVFERQRTQALAKSKHR